MNIDRSVALEVVQGCRATHGAIGNRSVLLLVLVYVALETPTSWSGAYGEPPDLDSMCVQTQGAAPTVTAPVNAPDQPTDARAREIALRLRELLEAARSTHGGDVQEHGVGRKGQSQARSTPESRARSSASSSHTRSVWIRERAGTPRQVKIQQPARVRSRVRANGETFSPEETAREFLRAERTLFALADPDKELSVARTDRDALGRTHVRFAQSYRGVPVWPADLIVHLDPAGNVDLVNGAYVATPRDLPNRPVIDAPKAQEIARAAVPFAAEASAEDPTLIVYAPGDRPCRLAWKVEVSAPERAQWRVIVDGLTGIVLLAYDLVPTAVVATSAVDLGGNLRSFNVWEQDGVYYMVDAAKSMFDAGSDPLPFDPTVGAVYVGAYENGSPDVPSSPSASAWDSDVVSLGFALSETYDYFLERHERASLNGEGGSILAVARDPRRPNNACWSPGENVAYFGSGFVGSLDVVAHELTHGVTTYTANLEYYAESGALNEAFSDIFGEMVEARTYGAPDWVTGGGLTPALRDHANPSRLEYETNLPYPSTASEMRLGPVSEDYDYGGVHYNSTVISHAFYLLAAGLPDAIGTADAERIFYRALTTHLVANSQFVDCRLQCVQAAEELFGAGSVQVQKVAEAFDAVEVVEAPATSIPPGFAPVSGPDATLFLYRSSLSGVVWLARREEALGDGSMGTPLVIDAPVSRPSISGDGTWAVYIDILNDVCVIPTDGSESSSCLGDPGTASSIAVSPDNELAAFVLLDAAGQPENAIRVANLTTSDVETFTLQAPTFDGGELDTVQYARGLDFTPDGRFLVYDALTTIDLGGGMTYGAWAIYSLDVESGAIQLLLPPLVGYDFAWPSLSNTSDRYVTFEADEVLSGWSYVGVYDRYNTLHSGLVVGPGHPGWPCFTGDDTAIVYSDLDLSAFTGSSLFRQALAEDTVTPDGDPELWLSDAELGVVYRRGEYTGPPADADVDGVPDETDNCREALNPDQRDDDEDGVGNVCDECPQDPDKVAPGECDCGVPDIDSDGDGTLDCTDECPDDPQKQEPGQCGCGVADVDSDRDGVPDCVDECPDDPQKQNPGQCGCGVADVDSDDDGIADCVDNCPTTANANQADADADGVGDACEPPPPTPSGGGCGAGIATVMLPGVMGVCCLSRLSMRRRRTP